MASSAGDVEKGALVKARMTKVTVKMPVDDIELEVGSDDTIYDLKKKIKAHEIAKQDRDRPGKENIYPKHQQVLSIFKPPVLAKGSFNEGHQVFKRKHELGDDTKVLELKGEAGPLALELRFKAVDYSRWSLLPLFLCIRGPPNWYARSIVEKNERNDYRRMLMWGDLSVSAAMVAIVGYTMMLISTSPDDVWTSPNYNATAEWGDERNLTLWDESSGGTWHPAREYDNNTNGWIEDEEFDKFVRVAVDRHDKVWYVLTLRWYMALGVLLLTVFGYLFAHVLFTLHFQRDIQDLVKRFDINEDGVLDKQELIDFFDWVPSRLNLKTSHSKGRDLLATADKNGDGKLATDELKDHLKKGVFYPKADKIVLGLIFCAAIVMSIAPLLVESGDFAEKQCQTVAPVESDVTREFLEMPEICTCPKDRDCLLYGQLWGLYGATIFCSFILALTWEAIEDADGDMIPLALKGRVEAIQEVDRRMRQEKHKSAELPKLRVESAAVKKENAELKDENAALKAEIAKMKK